MRELIPRRQQGVRKTNEKHKEAVKTFPEGNVFCLNTHLGDNKKEDIFVPSMEEVCFMLDRERYVQWKKRADAKDITEIVIPERDIKPLAEKCIALGAKIVLLKCGAPGMYYKTADEKELALLGNTVRQNWHG